MTVQLSYEQEQCTYNGISKGLTQGRRGPYKIERVLAVCNNGQIKAYPARLLGRSGYLGRPSFLKY